MNIKDILRMLKPLKIRMHFNNGLLCFFASLGIAGVVTTILAYASLWFPIPYLLKYIFYIYMFFATVGILISVISWPRTKSIIKTADALGLKERLTTALQLQVDESVVAQLQRQDTFKTVSGTDFKRLYPIQFPVKLIMIFAVSLILTSVSFMIPGYARETAKKIEKLQNVVNEQLKEIEKVNEELKKNDDLKEAELKKILDETVRMAEELKKARNEEDALKAVSRAENELKKLNQQEQMNKLGDALSMNDMTSGLGESMKNESMTDMKQALEQLMQQLEQEEISPEELAEMLEQAAEQEENNETAQELQQMAEEMASGSMESQTGVLQNLGDMLSDMMQSQGSTGLGQALGKLSQTMQQAKSSISQVDSSLSAVSQNSTNGSKQTLGQGTGQQTIQGNKGQGNTNAAAQQGNAAGQGQTPGSGQTGSQIQNGSGGAGEGSTNKDSGYTGREKSGGGRAAGEGEEAAFEQLYDPDHLGGDADPSQVSGQKQDGGQSSYSQADQIPVQKGAILPYHEVLTQYSDEAASYMEETEIPAAMKEIVREYFESLE